MAAVEGAQRGDLLIVDILDVGPIPQEDSGPLAGQGWGYTGVFATRNGGGVLTEQFPDAYKVIWDFSGGTATSRHVPGVSFTGIVHPGLPVRACQRRASECSRAGADRLTTVDDDQTEPLRSWLSRVAVRRRRQRCAATVSRCTGPRRAATDWAPPTIRR